MGDTTGVVAVGYDADLLAVASNPLEDLAALRQPLHVMARGRLADRLKVKRYPELDAELDEIMARPAE